VFVNGRNDQKTRERTVVKVGACAQISTRTTEGGRRAGGRKEGRERSIAAFGVIERPWPRNGGQSTAITSRTKTTTNNNERDHSFQHHTNNNTLRIMLSGLCRQLQSTCSLSSVAVARQQVACCSRLLSTQAAVKPQEERVEKLKLNMLQDNPGAVRKVSFLGVVVVS
jgi:hypothetical protein